MKLPAEQQAIQAKCFHPSGNFVEFPREDVETSIPARFEKIVKQFPGRIAVKTGNRTLTYQELNESADRLSHAVLAHRAEAQEPIALLMEHASSLFVAILGVLKAGKICVVLDPTFPKTRNSYLLEDSQVGLLITDSTNLPLAREYAHDRCRIVNVDDLESCFSTENAGLAIAAERFAFLIYTSGSTGQPKGVIQNHRNLLHDSRLYCNGLHICSDDRVALLYSCSASQGLKVTFAALLNGAVLYPYHVQQKGLTDLASWLNQEEITIYFSVPVLFRQFVGSLSEQDRFPRLRIIQLGSDLVTRGDLDLYRGQFSTDTVLIVRFGTTETGTLRRMFFDVKSPFDEATVPVGYGIEDTDLSLLDEEGNDVSFDAIGEVVVKSRYVSPGYWQQPKLTRDCFSPDPIGGDKRIYHTGDVGRMRSDGLLYHLGRKDYQLKIRGYRVEVGEIEAVLQAQHNIKEAIVAKAKTATGAEADRLIAYIVPFGRPLPSIHALRTEVGKKLPAYMVPSDFVFVESLPRTPNGKIDRRALPEPGKLRPELDIAFVSPRTDLETKLAKSWEKVLDVRPVGLHDNFFDLGGDSLIATRLISEVTSHFQSDIPLQFLFQSPTLAEMVALISKDKSGSADANPAGSDSLSIRPIPRERKFELSFAQRRMWFLNQLEPDSPVYNQIKALRLRGRLNHAVLRKALDAVVARHEVLRTTYSYIDDQPMQVVHDNGQFTLSVIDLMDVPIEQREDTLARFARDFCRRPFDLGEDWPVRGVLLRCADEDHVLVLVTHHIASDGWSNEILFGELSALYEAFCRGNASPLKDLPFQYADYAVWQKERLQGDVLQQQLSYWRKKLLRISPLELPTDHPRPTVLGHRGQTKQFSFPPALVDRLKKLGVEAKTTLSMTLLAAFQTLLHRYTGQDDIAVGTPIAGRNHIEAERLIGFFVNTLVLRSDLSGNPSFRELLGCIRQNALDAYSHQDVPFEKLVEELHPERDLNRNPFFQVAFQLRNYPKQAIHMGKLNVEKYQIGSGVAKFDLSMALGEDESGLAGELEYRTDLFDRLTIERMIGHFENLLEGIVANPDQPINQLPMLTAAEKQQLLVEWNDTQTDYPKDTCIHQLFEEQVEKTPDAVAVIFEDQKVSYRELNERANQLAHFLQKLGVGPDVVVGLCLERSIEMIVGLFAILKAGGAYLPIDPSHPKERLQFMLENAHAWLLLTQQQVASGLRSQNVLYLDTDWPKVAAEDTGNLHTPVIAAHLVYVIYTSGSTGAPKGVAVEHRQLSNYLSSIIDRLDLPSSKSFAVVSTLAADLGNTVIFGSLCTGAVLHVLSRDSAIDPEAMANYFSRHAIDCLKIVPSHLAGLQSSSLPGAVLPRKLLILGGEASELDWVKRLSSVAPNCRIVNHYGPTETTIGVLTYAVENDALPVGLTHLPLGRPLANTRIYILDQNLNAVPIGVAGEIYIAGRGLARGYLNRPDLTKEKFVANPLSGEPGIRLYKTGDRARYLPDGNVEFLGRIDNQIKLRGYRIELGEIESILAQHPFIRQARVIAREETAEDQRLVAYLVTDNDSAISTHDLRSYLRTKLPDYMMPSAIVFLDSLPLTANGKLDRKALPTPDYTPERDGVITTPRTPIEETIANIWAEVLKVEKVGIHDNFFDLGGHSLLATQVVARIRNSFKIDLPLRLLFDSPTIEGLARMLQSIEVK